MPEQHRARRPPLDVPAGYRVGAWQVTGLIGSGSWGSVYSALGPDGTRVAVKFLGTASLTPGQRSAMDDLVRREVRFSLAARHPHLIRTYEALPVRDPARPGLDGSTALVMDHADRSVRDVLDAATDGAPLPDANRILRGAADGLAHLHREGWLHGDLKPANILLGPRQQVWLADFGLSAELDGTHAYLPPMGTLDHLPPEWWSTRTGSQGTAVRPSADVWAFGVLAHQVLSGGRHPFPGATPRARALAAQSYARGITPLRLDPALPEAWRHVIAECLAPDHATRAALTAPKLAARVAEFAHATDHPGVPGPHIHGLNVSGLNLSGLNVNDPAAAPDPDPAADGTTNAPDPGPAAAARAPDPADTADPSAAGTTNAPDSSGIPDPAEVGALTADSAVVRRRRHRLLLPAGLLAVLLTSGTALLLTNDGHPGRPGSGSGPGPGGPSVAAVASLQNPLPPHGTLSVLDTLPADDTLPSRDVLPAHDTLPAHSDVPDGLRPSIDQAARLCFRSEVSPALIAAMLKAESGFDVHARRPATDEYGVAMWTPRVFNAWAVDGDLNGSKSFMSPPDAIATMGVYLCWIDQQIKQDGLSDDLPVLIAAAYRTSVRTIVDAKGVPGRVRPYADEVRRYLADYTAGQAPAATAGPG